MYVQVPSLPFNALFFFLAETSSSAFVFEKSQLS